LGENQEKRRKRINNLRFWFALTRRNRL
jgi:hypothetical protein